MSGSLRPMSASSSSGDGRRVLLERRHDPRERDPTRHVAGLGSDMTAPMERVLERLDRVKRNGDGWSARCPAHEDRNPSLSVSETADGRVLLRCFAGCGFAAIVAALGLEERDLFGVDGG